MFNIYTQKYVVVWLRVGPISEDLRIREVKGVPSLGYRPEWLDMELDQVSWDEIMQVNQYYLSDVPCEVEFALRNGLAPRQRFTVVLDKPRYYRCNHPLDPEEWDVEYDWDILDREFMKPEETANRWDQWIKSGYT